MRSTILAADQTAYDTFLDTYEVGDTYVGYFYDRHSVWIKVHDADTHKVVHEKKFRGNGKQLEYVLQSGGKKADYTVDGPVGGYPEER